MYQNLRNFHRIPLSHVRTNRFLKPLVFLFVSTGRRGMLLYARTPRTKILERSKNVLQHRTNNMKFHDYWKFRGCAEKFWGTAASSMPSKQFFDCNTTADLLFRLQQSIGVQKVTAACLPKSFFDCNTTSDLLFRLQHSKHLTQKIVVSENF